mmetsp:Transcript_17315/g.51188  ORF Transcript_17315/g.51188 Transcript_17315/m.51188 type:complete len:423 (-) Transcript_17315:62-1330(-)
MERLAAMRVWDLVADGAVRVFRWINWLLWWCPIRWVRTTVVEWQQPLLRWVVVRNLGELPRTGLHGDAVDVDDFREMLRHTATVFRQSPRSQFRAALRDEFDDLRQRHADVAWLCDTVLELDSEDGLFEAEKRYTERVALSPTPSYKQYLDRTHAMTNEMTADSRAQMVAGLERKYGPDAAAAKVAQIDAAHRAQKEQMAVEAAVLLERCACDAAHGRWVRATQVWNGRVAHLLGRWRHLDSGVGRKNCERGSLFETWASVVVAELVAHRWGTPVRVESNVMWADNVGEIDVLVSDSQGQPRALVELKANPLTIGQGLHQHERHRDAGTHVMVDGAATAIHPDMPIIVATTIPPHGLRLPADRDIMHGLTEALSHGAVDVEALSFIELLQLGNAVREKIGVAALARTPLDVAIHHPHLIVVV